MIWTNSRQVVHPINFIYRLVYKVAKNRRSERRPDDFNWLPIRSEWNSLQSLGDRQQWSPVRNGRPTRFLTNLNICTIHLRFPKTILTCSRASVSGTAFGDVWRCRNQFARSMGATCRTPPNPTRMPVRRSERRSGALGRSPSLLGNFSVVLFWTLRSTEDRRRNFLRTKFKRWLITIKGDSRL